MLRTDLTDTSGRFNNDNNKSKNDPAWPTASLVCLLWDLCKRGARPLLISWLVSVGVRVLNNKIQKLKIISQSNLEDLGS